MSHQKLVNLLLSSKIERKKIKVDEYEKLEKYKKIGEIQTIGEIEDDINTIFYNRY